MLRLSGSEPLLCQAALGALSPHLCRQEVLLCDSPEWVPVDFGVPEMASATNIDWGPLQMVALLRLPRAEFLATTASWLSLPRPSSVPRLPSPAHRNRTGFPSQGQVFPPQSFSLPQQLPLEERTWGWAVCLMALGLPPGLCRAAHS